MIREHRGGPNTLRARPGSCDSPDSNIAKQLLINLEAAFPRSTRFHVLLFHAHFAKHSLHRNVLCFKLWIPNVLSCSHAL
jgi:hypothetical protein